MPGPRFVPHHDSPSREVRVFISSHGFEAPTPSTSGRQAGKLTGPWSFPTAAASTQPRPPRPFVRARSKARVMTSVGGPPPHQLEVTSARPSSPHQSIAAAGRRGGPLAARGGGVPTPPGRGGGGGGGGARGWGEARGGGGGGPPPPARAERASPPRRPPPPRPPHHPAGRAAGPCPDGPR